MASIYQRGKHWHIQWSDSDGRHREPLGKISKEDAQFILKNKEYEIANTKLIKETLNMDSFNNLSERVKGLRLGLGLSQSQLAGKLGISYMNIANIETGRVTNPRYMSELASALETTTSYLIDGSLSEKVEVETPTYIASLTQEINQDITKDYWVVEVNKDDKLFLTDSAKKVSKIKQIFQ
jgi:transcriptional regulator with XRE-family HTH domain